MVCSLGVLPVMLEMGPKTKKCVAFRLAVRSIHLLIAAC